MRVYCAGLLDSIGIQGGDGSRLMRAFFHMSPVGMTPHSAPRRRSRVISQLTTAIEIAATVHVALESVAC